MRRLTLSLGRFLVCVKELNIEVRMRVGLKVVYLLVRCLISVNWVRVVSIMVLVRIRLWPSWNSRSCFVGLVSISLRRINCLSVSVRFRWSFSCDTWSTRVRAKLDRALVRIRSVIVLKAGIREVTGRVRLICLARKKIGTRPSTTVTIG